MCAWTIYGCWLFWLVLPVDEYRSKNCENLHSLGYIPTGGLAISLLLCVWQITAQLCFVGGSDTNEMDDIAKGMGGASHSLLGVPLEIPKVGIDGGFESVNSRPIFLSTKGYDATIPKVLSM